MTYVYVIESICRRGQYYIGITDNLRQRFRHHNEGKSFHTRKFKPWGLIAYFAFADRHIAGTFERYLKSGSGRAFLRRHVLGKPSIDSRVQRKRPPNPDT